MSTSTLLRPQDLRQIASDAEMKKMDEEDEFAKKKRQQQDELRKAFMDRVVQPDAIDRSHRIHSLCRYVGGLNCPSCCRFSARRI